MTEGPPLHRVLDAADRAEARAERMKAPKEERRQGRGRLSSMDTLPEEAQEDIVWAVGQLNMRERQAKDILFELNDRLAAKDIDPISSSAFNRKSIKLAAMSNRLAEARHIFAGLAPQFSTEKIDEHTLVLGEFIKLLIFELAQGDGSAVGPKGAMELAKAHLAVIQGQTISAERRGKMQREFAARAVKEIDRVAAVKGLSDEVRADLRRDLFGVVDGPRDRA